MRFANFKLLSGVAASATTNSIACDMDQIIKMSAQLNIPSGTATGTLQLQVSNDAVFTGNILTNTPSWSNLGASAAISGTGSVLVPQQDICYRALRAVYTSTFANVATITAVADIAGSLNSKFFLASSTTGNFYFWFDNGAGVDPAVSGRTGIHVVYTTGATATTLGGLIRTAAAGNGWTVTGATSQAILTNSPVGPSAPAADGSAPTGFTISNTQPTASMNLSLMCLGV